MKREIKAASKDTLSINSFLNNKPIFFNKFIRYNKNVFKRICQMAQIELYLNI